MGEWTATESEQRLIGRVVERVQRNALSCGFGGPGERLAAGGCVEDDRGTDDLRKERVASGREGSGRARRLERAGVREPRSIERRPFGRRQAPRETARWHPDNPTLPPKDPPQHLRFDGRLEATGQDGALVSAARPRIGPVRRSQQECAGTTPGAEDADGPLRQQRGRAEEFDLWSQRGQPRWNAGISGPAHQQPRSFTTLRGEATKTAIRVTGVVILQLSSSSNASAPRRYLMS